MESDGEQGYVIEVGSCHQIAPTAEISCCSAISNTGTHCRCRSFLTGVQLNVRQECFMRHVILPIVTALALGAASPAMTPALAQDSGGQISMQVALDVATDLGIMTVSQTEFQGDQWDIEGRDGRGRWMEVYVDSRTGEVRHVDRGW
jgi:hypothetical protein